MTAIGNEGGGARRVRQPRKDGWTKERRAAFLEVLAATGNASAAARSLGKSVSSAQQLRRRNPAFARLWEEALTLGYERLEHELLAHAIGVAREEDGQGEGREGLPAFDPALALKLLQLRRDRSAGAGAGRKPLPASDEQIDRALRSKLDRLLRRVEEA